MTCCFTHATARLRPLVQEELRRLAGDCRPRNVLIKPNWVQHEVDPAFPIRALVTDTRLIEAVVEACLTLFPAVETVTVGDCPLQSADWPLLCAQSELVPVMERFERKTGGRVRFLDLRREVFRRLQGSYLVPADTPHGDPRGYREVLLGSRSHLEPISGEAQKFAVNDYSAAVTRSNHRRGDHRYLVSQTVLDCDLFINLPKWKAHQKSGITGALKNLVGINADKAYLPHFRRGAPKWGGDEYADDQRWLYWTQTTLRELVQKRSQLLYRLLKPGWEFIKRTRGIETRMDSRHAQPQRFYAAGGSWHGNQTIWRMIYDLNLIIQCADAAGRLQPAPQRRYVSIVDGLVCGEGNGPLQPLPRETDWVVCGDDPFAVDTALGWFMGFYPEKLPVLARRGEFLGPEWGDFELDALTVEVDGAPLRLLESPVNFRFTPPPGWRNHIER